MNMWQRVARWVGTGLLALLGLSTFTGQAQAQDIKLEPLTIKDVLKGVKGIMVWTRGAGNYAQGKAVVRVREQKLLWKKLRLQQKTLFDVQYQKKASYQGIYIKDILRRYRPSPDTDLALLHFRNGMVVPYPLKPIPGEKPLHVFVATSIKQKKRWTRTFPIVSRTPSLPIFKDNRPVIFHGNKIVVSTENHPMVLDHVAPNIKLWHRVSSLQGIELVQAAAYYRQFAGPNKPMVRKGWLMYRGSCQFCHGVRKIGASFGNDFVTPLAIYLYAFNPNELHYHVTFKTMDAMHRGKAMPAIKNMPKVQVKYLWHWLKAIARHPIPAYQPRTQGKKR